MKLSSLSASLMVMLWSVPIFGADANAGKTFFQQQCALCHSAEPNDNGGAQGQSLNGVFSRRAASSPGFTYGSIQVSLAHEDPE